ncbi:MAG TPA: class I SAM-dependent methyltransferase [Thermomicrobiales bacterium]|nr:class I SAM-dependent methyltransferase [Thermomicrobiales bacterium]
MDERTIASYEANAGAIFRRHISHGRSRMNDRIVRHFHAGGQTADIGSGSGIMLDWLQTQGYPAIGYEPVAALRNLSTTTFPAITVLNDALPDLETIPNDTYANVLCSAVLMHLPIASVPASIANLVRILAPGGRLLLTYRNGHGDVERETDDRLFTPLAIDVAAAMILKTGAQIQEQVVEADPDRPDIHWTIFTVERS